jgi:hypothetical protein
MRRYILGCTCFLITGFTVIHLSIQKYKPEPIETLRFGGMKIAFTNLVICLGVFVDPKLNWKQHLTERVKKVYSSVWACKRVMGKSSGIKSSIAMWMYKTVLVPQILW